MSIEPNALIKAGHACRNMLPNDSHLYVTLDNQTWIKISKVVLQDNYRVRLQYFQERHRHQVTVDYDTPLVLSFDDLSDCSVSKIMRGAKWASSPFREFGRSSLVPAGSQDGTLGSNYYG
jgi:hypothetical protein